MHVPAMLKEARRGRCTPWSDTQSCDAGYVCCKLNSSYLEKQEVKASNPLLRKARASCLKTVQLLAGKHRALSSSIWLFHKSVLYKFKLYVKAQFNSKFCLLDCELR